MTVKEIAELCGVTEQTVLNWAHKFDGSDQKIWSDIFKKLANAGHGVPADFTLDETLAIIGEGGGNKALASLLAENAVNKDALAIQTGHNQAGALLAAIEGLRADFQKFLETGNQKALPDPKEAAYQELENFVERTMGVEPAKIHRPSVHELYHAYEKEAQNPMGKQDFMFTIALKHPEFELKFSKKEWYFTRCYVRRVI
jgi:predicted transcriptional regulator